MSSRSLRWVVPTVVLASVAGCHTPFSPQWSRHEIERQTGQSPQDSFEFKLGGATMKLAKLAASGVAGESVDFAGLTRVDLAIYSVPSGGRVDFAAMRFKGWDKLIQTQVGDFNLLVLVRTDGKTLNDLVVFAQGDNQLLYGRQKGRLDPALPTAIQKVLQTDGLQGLKEKFLSSAQSDERP